MPEQTPKEKHDEIPVRATKDWMYVDFELVIRSALYEELFLKENV